jgi:predicted amidohydrolase YtcJ
MPQVEALGIRDGIVCAAGTLADVTAIMGDTTYTLDLQGNPVIPGLTDAHVHIISHGLTLRQTRLDGIADFEFVCAKIADAAQRLPAGKWLEGGGWQAPCGAGAWPTASELEALAPNRPALLTRKDGHSAWMNHTAMQIAGITRDTPDPDGGHIDRDANGDPTGIFKETAIDLVRRFIPDITDEDRIQAVASRLCRRLPLRYGGYAWLDRYEKRRFYPLARPARIAPPWRNAWAGIDVYRP